jgi:hypothetical protein
MSSRTYSSGQSISQRQAIRLISGAGQLEIAVLAVALALGIAASLLLDNFIVGFATVGVLAIACRLALAVLRGFGDGSGRPR